MQKTKKQKKDKLDAKQIQNTAIGIVMGDVLKGIIHVELMRVINQEYILKENIKNAMERVRVKGGIHKDFIFFDDLIKVLELKESEK